MVALACTGSSVRDDDTVPNGELHVRGMLSEDTVDGDVYINEGVSPFCWFAVCDGHHSDRRNYLPRFLTGGNYLKHFIVFSMEGHFLGFSLKSDPPLKTQ